MNSAAYSDALAVSAADVDRLAERVVDALVDIPGGRLSAAVKFARVENDACSFVAYAHRRKLHFDFVHVLADHPYGAQLAGRYHIFDVDRKGDWTGREGSATIYPPGDILFDGARYSLPASAGGSDKANLRDGFAVLAARIAQADLKNLKDDSKK